MGSATWKGADLKAIAMVHGWIDGGPGANHPFLMKKPGHRTVPLRGKIQNRHEARSVLKQMEIPRSDWPENLQ